MGGVELPSGRSIRSHLKMSGAILALPPGRSGERGLKIASIAGTVDEPMIAACGDAGVPIIRICSDDRPHRQLRKADRQLPARSSMRWCRCSIASA